MKNMFYDELIGMGHTEKEANEIGDLMENYGFTYDETKREYRMGYRIADDNLRERYNSKMRFNKYIRGTEEGDSILKVIKKLGLSEYNLSYAEKINEVSISIKSDDYEHCEKVKSYNSQYIEYFSNDYVKAEQVYLQTKNLDGDKLNVFMKINHPNWYELYIGHIN